MSLIEKDESVAVFIDGQFLLKGLEATVPGKRPDYHKIVTKLIVPGHLTRAWYYTAPPPPYLSPEKRERSAKHLEKISALPFFEVIVRRVQKRTRRVVPVGQSQSIEATYYEQKGVDVKIAIDMMAKAYRGDYTTAVLISGDGDFVDLVKLLKEMGKHVINVTSPRNEAKRYYPSNLLRRACDGSVSMDATFLAGCELTP